MVADVYGAIKEIFGLDIPLMVIKKIISNYESINGLSIEYYNNEHFKIIEPWDVSSNNVVDNKCKQYEEQFEELETAYNTFKVQIDINDDINFIDFISTNTEEVLGYFENNDLGKLDERYFVLAYFLKHLQETNDKLRETYFVFIPYTLIVESFLL